MSMKPTIDDLLDVVLEKDTMNQVRYVARFKVLKHDEERDLYLMQMVEVRTEKEDEDGIPI